MRICVLATRLDSFKGGNHLPLFGGLPETEFLVVTARATFDGTPPPNVKVETLGTPLGPYYFGKADDDFANALLARHPAESDFWKTFDVIHLNQTLSPKLLALAKTGKPLLYAIHHPVTADREVAMEESNVWIKILWYLRYARLIRWQRELARRVPHLLTVSQTVKERLVREYGCDEKKISIVHNGVDGHEFRPTEEPATADVIAVGSFVHPRKGFRYLIAAYRALAALGFRIADVGRRTGAQSAQLKMIPGVTIYGPLPHARLVEMMRGSQVLLSTALYEGFGISLIEALACGHPAIAFGAGAVPEVLGSIDASLVVPVRDTAELVRRARDFLRFEPSEKKKIGERLRTAVLERFAMEKAAAQLRALYAAIADNRQVREEKAM